MNGTLDVLNCGAGHMQFAFNNNDPIELERAKRVVQDMLKRGYALFIEDDNKKLHKVKMFDETRGVYIIADGALYAGETVNASDDESQETAGNETLQANKPKRGRPKGVSMRRARATGIGPTAGG